MTNEVKRVRVVSDSEIMGEAAMELLTPIVATHTFVTLFFFAIFWVVRHFAPSFVTADIGIFVYLAIPATIAFEIYLTIKVLSMASNVILPMWSLLYSLSITAGSFYLIKNTGWIGHSGGLGYILYCIVAFVVIFLIIFSLFQISFIAKTLRAMPLISLAFYLLFLQLVPGVVEVIYANKNKRNETIGMPEWFFAIYDYSCYFVDYPASFNYTLWRTKLDKNGHPDRWGTGYPASCYRIKYGIIDDI